MSNLIKVDRGTRVGIERIGSVVIEYKTRPTESLFAQPHITRKTGNMLSLFGVLVVGGLLTLLYASHGHYRTAVFMYPVCFGLWGYTEFVWGPLPRKLPIPLQWLLYIGIVAGLVWFCFFR